MATGDKMEQAAIENDLDEIRKLYKRDKNSVNNRGVWRWTPLMRAADNNSYEACKVLLEECSAPVDDQDKWGHTALHISTTKGYERLTELFLKHKADVNFKDKMGRTPLMLASYNGHIGTVHILLQNRALLDIKSEENMTAVDMAKKGGRKEVYFQLIFAKNHGTSSRSTGATNECTKCGCGRCKADGNNTENLQTKITTLETDLSQLKLKAEKTEKEVKEQKDKERECDELRNLAKQNPSPPSLSSGGSDVSLPASPTTTGSTVFSNSSYSSSQESSLSCSSGYASFQQPASGQRQQSPFVPLQSAQQVVTYQHVQQPTAIYPQNPGMNHPAYQPQPGAMYQHAPQGHACYPYGPVPHQQPIPQQQQYGLAYPPPQQPVHHHQQPMQPQHHQQQPMHPHHHQQQPMSMGAAGQTPDSDDPLDHIENAKLTSQILSGVAEKTGGDQMKLATALGISDPDVKNAASDNPNKQTNATLELLTRWKNGLDFNLQRSNRTMFSILFKALKDIKRNDVIVHVVDMVEANPQLP